MKATNLVLMYHGMRMTGNGRRSPKLAGTYMLADGSFPMRLCVRETQQGVTLRAI